MTPEILTIAMFITLIIFIITGLPLAFCLASVAMIFGLIDNGFNVWGLFDMFANNAWGLMNNYVLVAIPLFILMAQLLDHSKVSEQLFETLYILLGKIKGGLGVAVIIVCTIFAATTGIIGASVVAMGLLATPALLGKGYQKEMVSGIICASGTLGILIPPSIMMVIFSGLTGLKETSVGNLFAGSILPGFLLSSLYLFYIFVRCNLNPTLGPPISEKEADKWNASQKYVMIMKSFIPPLALILTVMGTILKGIATPTEAAGLGAAGALILACINRQLNWKVLQQAAFNTLRTTSMVMMLFIGGLFFSTVFLSMGGGDVVADLMIGSGWNNWFILFIMMSIVFIMGMFIDWAAILLITVPVFMPIVVELGFDPLWFAILMCVNLQTSFITPPFGYALFYFAGVAPKEYSMMHIYKGIIPFVLLQIVGLILMILFPSVITWLPLMFFQIKYFA